jgi:hypothetical protein
MTNGLSVPARALPTAWIARRSARSGSRPRAEPRTEGRNPFLRLREFHDMKAHQGTAADLH